MGNLAFAREFEPIAGVADSDKVHCLHYALACLVPGKTDGGQMVDLEYVLEDVVMAYYNHMAAVGGLREDTVQAVVVDHSSYEAAYSAAGREFGSVVQDMAWVLGAGIANKRSARKGAVTRMAAHSTDHL